LIQSFVRSPARYFDPRRVERRMHAEVRPGGNDLLEDRFSLFDGQRADVAFAHRENVEGHVHDGDLARLAPRVLAP
jgi:hypothetical protein